METEIKNLEAEVVKKVVTTLTNVPFLTLVIKKVKIVSTHLGRLFAAQILTQNRFVVMEIMNVMNLQCVFITKIARENMIAYVSADLREMETRNLS